MSVPGDILSALIASGEIPDPFYAKNELSAQWVGREDWLMIRDFGLPPAFEARESIFLDIEVIDTIAEIRLNGSLLGTSANMFRRLRAEAKRPLQSGKNRLEILIRSAEKAAEAAASTLPYPIPCSEYPVSSPHRNLIRKAQCMSGWDWGPCLMTGGVYDGIALIGIDGPRIEYANATSRRVGGSRWAVDIEIELFATEPGSAIVEAQMPGLASPIAHDTRGKAEGGAMPSIVSSGLSGAEARPRNAAPSNPTARPVEAGAGAWLKIDVPSGLSKARLGFEVEGAEPWWPAGYGAQPLYGLEMRVSPAGGIPATGQVAPSAGHRLSKRLGFRELELVAREDEQGRSMTFRVNGKDIFAKGANWIPADALPSRWTRSRIAQLLDSAVAANMNCLRVWGGGRYESEDFYELCDERGLLLWQDLMFSCALYPSSPAFLAEVEAELRHQVRRLADHPSLALWCGNNEALGAIGWYEESKKSPARYIADYDRLTEGTAGRVVRELDPLRPWWPSSPSAGPDDYSDNWQADGRGDMHYWSVWHEGKPFSAYLEVRPRFCSEFGFQSFPSYAAASSFAPEGERNPTSPIMEHHQRHPRGNTLIIETMARYFRMPRGLRETLYLSQVQQALAIRSAVEYWRSLRPRCMGTLYWQLNDVWPVSSWSSLEYDGSWKLLHYEARRFYDPFLLAAYVKDGELVVVCVNDSERVHAGSLRLRFLRFDGSEATRLDSEAHIAAESSSILWRGRLESLPARADELFLCAELEAELEPSVARLGRPNTELGGTPAARSAPADRGTLTRRCEIFLVEPKRCALIDPRVEAKVLGADAPKSSGPCSEARDTSRSSAHRGLVIELQAAAPAFFLALEAEGLAGKFSDQGFTLLAGEKRKIAFAPDPGKKVPSPAELAAALRLYHLKSSYE